MTLRKGDKGTAVKNLQSALNRAGTKLDVDGDFGELTEKAVTSFQIEYGLTADGIAGEKTFKVLDLVVAVEAIKDCLDSVAQIPAVKRLEEILYG